MPYLIEITASPVDMINLPAPGFYPTTETIIAQAVMLPLVAAAFVWTRNINRRGLKTA